MTPVVAAALLGVAVALLLVPGGRAARPTPARLRARRRRHGRTRPPDDLDLGVLVTEVGTRLRAGAPVEKAWEETFARVGLGASAGVVAEDGVPPQLLALAARPTPDRSRRWRLLRRHDPVLSATTAGALPGTLAACRLTRELGAPLADVLQRCAEGLTEAGSAESARAVALAGPRATARLLGWLPALGLLLGLGVGTDPIAVLLDGGAGSVCLVTGSVLMVAGHRWVRSLERTAGTAGRVRTRRRRIGRRERS
ncbi:hypothetical protein GCM10023169_10630 [Georgenia halophila]|uniref:Tight adherence protein B n=1 Tax=Georgenia halophila TaxID=620889 RepID=A0ABP8L0I2_9MICO